MPRYTIIVDTDTNSSNVWESSEEKPLKVRFKLNLYLPDRNIYVNQSETTTIKEVIGGEK